MGGRLLRTRSRHGVGELRELALEEQLRHAGGAVAVLANVHLRDRVVHRRLARLVLELVRVVGGAPEEHDDVGVLLDRAGVAQIGDARRVLGKQGPGPIFYRKNEKNRKCRIEAAARTVNLKFDIMAWDLLNYLRCPVRQPLGHQRGGSHGIVV